MNSASFFSAEVASAERAVELRNISKGFGHGNNRVVAVNNVSLEIQNNEFFTLLGPSGCGKTTLLRLLAGFEQPDSGELLLAGDAMAGLPPFRRPVNTVFQSYALFPHLTVAQNVGFSLEMQNWPPARRERRIAEMLRLVQLENLGNRYPAQLSGGQQQRVALARALASQPKVLLLDEPLSALDLKLRKEMQLELKRLQTETGITFVFVTHDQQEALTMSDRIAVMHQGELLQIGSPTAIYERPQRRFVADFIGESNFIKAVYQGESRFVLAQGPEVVIPDSQDGIGFALNQNVTLTARPERTRLTTPAQGALRGRVENIVYIGTDTSYFVTTDGGRFQARLQNSGDGPVATIGDEVGISFAADALRVLVD